MFNIVYEKPLTVIEIHEHDSDDCAVSHLRKANLIQLVVLYPYRDEREEMTVPILNKGTIPFFLVRQGTKVDHNYIPQFSNLVDRSEFDTAGVKKYAQIEKIEKIKKKLEIKIRNKKGRR